MRFDPATDPDAELYDDLRNGSGEIAARELMRRIKKFVCKKCPDFTPDADEIALDIFERICEKLDTFREECRFFTWVGGIARNTVLERLREKGKEPLSADFLLDLEAEGEYGDPEKRLLEKTTHDINCLLVQEFLKTLPERQRQVFVLKHCSEPKKKAEQIGEKLGISAGAVRSAFADANAALERWLKKNGY